MSFGFMAWLVVEARKSSFSTLDRAGLTVYILGGVGFTLMFLISGALSVPRRWAVHAEEWFLQDRLATGFAVLIIAGALIFVLIYARGLMNRKPG